MLQFNPIDTTSSLNPLPSSICRSIILPKIIYFVFQHLHPLLLPDYRLLFVFSRLRSPVFLRPSSPISLFFRAIDKLPRGFSSVVSNTATCLLIPLEYLYILSNNSPYISKSIRKLTASSAYHLCPQTLVTVPFNTRSQFRSHPNLSRHFLKLVQTNEILLQPFFLRTFLPSSLAPLAAHPYLPPSTLHVDSTPFLDSLQITNTIPLTSRLYRNLTSMPIDRVLHFPPSLWSLFWSLQLHHQSRNIWFRAIHNSLPYKEKLHRFNPDYFDTNICQCCSAGTETIQHFIYECSLKYSVWESIWNEYFSPAVSLTSIHNVLFSLQLPDVLPSAPLPNAPIVSCILLGIWRAHWNVVFNDTPFIPATITTSIRNLIRTFSREILLSTSSLPSPDESHGNLTDLPTLIIT